MSSRQRSARRRLTHRRIKGGGWNQIINQAVAPIALLGMSYAFSKKRSEKKRSVKRSEKKRIDKRSNKTRRR